MMGRNKLYSHEIQHAVSLHKLISKTLDEYEDSIKSMEHVSREEGPTVILKINWSDVQIYPSTSGNVVYLSINGIARVVESFEEVKCIIEKEVTFLT